MALIHVTDQTFDQQVMNSNKPVLVDFYANWCGPCRMIASILDEVNHELADDVVIAKVDVDKNPIVSARYGIMSIPTLTKTQLVSMIKNYL